MAKTWILELDGEVVEVVAQTGNCTDNQNRDDSDEEARVHILQAVAFDDGVPEYRISAEAGQNSQKGDRSQGG